MKGPSYSGQRGLRRMWYLIRLLSLPAMGRYSFTERLRKAAPFLSLTLVGIGAVGLAAYLANDGAGVLIVILPAMTGLLLVGIGILMAVELDKKERMPREWPAREPSQEPQAQAPTGQDAEALLLADQAQKKVRGEEPKP